MREAARYLYTLAAKITEAGKMFPVNSDMHAAARLRAWYYCDAAKALEAEAQAIEDQAPVTTRRDSILAH